MTAARVLVPAILVIALLPIGEYRKILEELPREHHPVRTAGQCLERVRAAELAAGRTAPGVYAIGGARWFLHTYFYYLHRVGWEEAKGADDRALDQALDEPGRQRPIMIGDEEYGQLRQRRGEAVQGLPALRLRNVFLLMPGPYGVCAPAPVPTAAR
jgi:hypothetical protein